MDINPGEITKTVYTLVKKNKYLEAIDAILSIAGADMTRAGLSILGHCYYYTQDFQSAANCYEQLHITCPDVPDYKFYYAQSLFQASLYEKALKVVNEINSPDSQLKVIKLKAAIKYGDEDLSSAKSFVDLCPKDDPETEVNLGCLLYKEGRYEDALIKFMQALQTTGFQAHLLYNVALCHYRLKDYEEAKKFIGDIIDHGIRLHPELSVGTVTEGIDSHSVGNTLSLHQTALIEAFNLKAAIEYSNENDNAAREALTDMPPRNEPELDAVTLHNQAILSVSLNERSKGLMLNPSSSATGNIEEAFEKLQFLLHQETFPAETFYNLLLLYCRTDRYEIAADILAENTELTYKYLTPYMFEYLDAIITRETSATEGYLKLDTMSGKLTETLRKLTRTVQDAREREDTQAVRNAVFEYDDTLTKFIPILMAQARICWDLGDYEKVERLFQKSAEFCNDNEVWKLNVAHTLFMQGNKYKEAASFYEPLIRTHYGNILSVSAIALANLCVCYIMTSQNEEAEELMRKIEREEEQLGFDDSSRKSHHLCIVNIVIGTLYCAKGNYEFGISRVIKSLEPQNNKLSADTWSYVKRCLLSMIENLAMHTLVLRDAVLQECLHFLEMCEVYGRNVGVLNDNDTKKMSSHLSGKHFVTYEARLLKYIILKIMKC